MLRSSRSLALALVLAAAPVLHAQNASRVDLSGDWRGSAGVASFGEKRLENGQDVYRVSVSRDGRVLTGTATFNGQRLRFSSEALAGMVCALTGEGTAGPAQHMGFDYQRETGIDRLLAPRGTLERTRASTQPSSGPWQKPTGKEKGHWGKRSQVAATVAQLDGLEKNDHWWGFVTRNPLVTKMLGFFKPGFTTTGEKERLSKFVAEREAAWGLPTTDLPPGSIKDFDLFRAQKAIALDRFGRTPADVTEGFLDARGSIAGNRIADRRIFWQRWKPGGKPSGRLVVISPGFQETGRNFYEQIQLLNQQGDDVIVMDHQWAGYSDGEPGGLDRGYGVARDVAATVAFAHQVAPDEKLVLFGNSMGGGPGALGAATLNDNGLVQLDGPSMPTNVPLVLQAPFVRANPSFLNKTFGVVSHIPLVNGIELPALGLPILTHDADAATRFANHASAEDVRAQSRSMTAANEDLAAILDLVNKGKGPTNRVYVLHEKDDPLADSGASQELVKAIGSRARLDLMEGNNHVLEESPSERARFLPGIVWATVR